MDTENYIHIDVGIHSCLCKPTTLHDFEDWFSVFTFCTRFIFISHFKSRKGAPVAQWVKRWPTDLAGRVRSSLEVKSSQP